MVVIFLGWLVLQWSNFVMRTVAIGLISTTLWVLIQSIRDDRRRSHGRQIQIVGETLSITQAGTVTTIPLAQVAKARWQDEPTPGLFFHDDQGQSLAHLDSDFLANQAEARCFLGWLRKHANLSFKVRWPSE